jgi:hypothetical protein
MVAPLRSTDSCSIGIRIGTQRCDSKADHFLLKKFMMLPWPLGAPFFAPGFEACEEADDGAVDFGFVGGGASSSENDSQAGSWMVTMPNVS